MVGNLFKVPEKFCPSWQTSSVTFVYLRILFLCLFVQPDVNTDVLFYWNPSFGLFSVCDFVKVFGAIIYDTPFILGRAKAAKASYLLLQDRAGSRGKCFWHPPSSGIMIKTKPHWFIREVWKLFPVDIWKLSVPQSCTKTPSTPLILHFPSSDWSHVVNECMNVVICVENFNSIPLFY